MLLLTGATGEVGRALLPRLLGDGYAVRCLVRDPRRLGTSRVRVQIALGDLADPPSFRNAMRGVETVVHLAASIRDQESGSIEELNGIASWRMVEAAREAGVRRFVFFSALGASTHSRGRFFRAKALAEQAVNESGLASVVFAPSLVYAPHDRWLTLLERMSAFRVTPISGRGRATFQPIWTEDVADCVLAALRDEGPARSGDGDGDRRGEHGLRRRYELAGPQTLTLDEVARVALRSLGRSDTLLHVPAPLAFRALALLDASLGTRALPSADEVELLEVPMICARGAADAEALGVAPRRIETVLGAA
ncbi:MAG: NAD(P)H-binding protein [Solirubrobacteraceae bacterium]